MFNKKFFYFLIFLIFLIFFYFLFFPVDKLDKKINKIKIDKNIFEVELAISEKEKYLGLSYRESIPENFGMLFLFSEKEIRNFVMRDMFFSLDIVFIDKNIIVDVYKNLPYNFDSQKTLYTSSVPVDKVLELKGGACDKKNIKVGDKIKFLY